MRHAQCHAHGGLPVSLQLIAAEIKVPAGNSVKFAHHSYGPLLAHGRLTLLRCREFQLVTAQYIDARDMECPVIAHHLSADGRLPFECPLSHDMSRKHDAILLAPSPQCIAEGGRKTLRQEVMIQVPRS